LHVGAPAAVPRARILIIVLPLKGGVVSDQRGALRVKDISNKRMIISMASGVVGVSLSLH